MPWELGRRTRVQPGSLDRIGAPLFDRGLVGHHRGIAGVDGWFNQWRPSPRRVTGASLFRSRSLGRGIDFIELGAEPGGRLMHVTY